MDNFDPKYDVQMDNVTANIINNALNLPLYLNITLINMLLRSLTTQKYSPVTTSVFEKEYDFIIVGAGSAGSVLASRLSELPCITVLLLEAGPSPPIAAEVPGLSSLLWGSSATWPYRTVPQKNSAKGQINNTLNYGMGKVVGGSSTVNGMVYVRGNAKNYDGWAASGEQGWSYKDVLPYFKKVEHNFNPEYVDKEFHGFHGPMSVMQPPSTSELTEAFLNAARELGYRIGDYNGGTPTGFSRTQFNMRNGQRCSVAKAYLTEAGSRPNLHIVKEAFVTKVLIRNHRTPGVEFDYLGKRRQVYSKKEVIVSAGALNTPKLLMLSGIGPRKELKKFKIPQIADLPVGSNFHDHPYALMPYRMNGASKFQKLRDVNELKAYVENRTGSYSIPFAVADGFLNFSKKFSDDVMPDYQIIVHDGMSSHIRVFNLEDEVYEKVFAPHANETVLWCSAFLLNPRSKGTIKLRSSNPYDAPLIDPNFFADPGDIRDLVRAMKECNAVADTAPMRRIGVKRWKETYPGCEMFVKDSDQYLECQVKLVTIPGYHPAGSAKMGGTNDTEAVVDPKLRVKGIKGLRVVDASIMPQVVSGNTNNPVLMIAEKAADIIKETISCH